VKKERSAQQEKAEENAIGDRAVDPVSLRCARYCGYCSFVCRNNISHLPTLIKSNPSNLADVFEGTCQIIPTEVGKKYGISGSVTFSMHLTDRLVCV